MDRPRNLGRLVRVVAQRTRPVVRPLLPALPHAFMDRFVDALAKWPCVSILENPVDPEHEFLERVVDFRQTVCRIYYRL